MFSMNDLFRMFEIFQSSLYSGDREEEKNQEPDAQSTNFTWEESILVTLLGENYLQFVNAESGEWQHEEKCVGTFQHLFEERIRYLFDADSLE